jgi:hypothetical protein
VKFFDKLIKSVCKAIKKHMEPIHIKQDELLLKAIMEKDIAKIKLTEEKDKGGRDERSKSMEPDKARAFTNKISSYKRGGIFLVI